MQKQFAALIAATALTVGAPVASAPAHPHDAHVIAAKSCSSGWKHAVIGGQHKCLRRGQFCARARDRDYHRYGYHCHKRDRRGSYHLT